jgi:hypothetical protein
MFVSQGQAKRCGRCELVLPIDAFNRMGSGTQHWCRACFRAYFKARGVQHREQSAAARRKRVAVARGFVDTYLSVRPCVDCGEADRAVLDFDHVAGKEHW